MYIEQAQKKVRICLLIVKNPPQTTTILKKKKIELKLLRLYYLIILQLLLKKSFKKFYLLIFYFSLFQISDMTDSILDSFKTILSELEWMDKDTREVAEQKVRGLLTSKRILERPTSRNKYLVSYKDSIYSFFFKEKLGFFFFVK